MSDYEDDSKRAETLMEEWDNLEERLRQLFEILISTPDNKELKNIIQYRDSIFKRQTEIMDEMGRITGLDGGDHE
jgi:hypothetical protein